MIRIAGSRIATAWCSTIDQGTSWTRSEIRISGIGCRAGQRFDLRAARADRPAPVSLPQAPYLDAIVQTDQGIVQLIAVEKVRGCFASVVLLRVRIARR